MENTYVDDAVELLEKANADLDPELISIPERKRRLETYARARRQADFGIAALAGSLDDAERLARVTGTSVGKARETVATGKTLGDSRDLSAAFQMGSISLDQANEIARAEEASPGAAKELVKVAKREPFHVLRDEARKAKLEAEQHKGLAKRQRAARTAQNYCDALGMVNIHLALEPHVGAPIMARAEAEAERLARAAKKSGGDKEPFERYLADGYAKLLSGAGKGRPTRPELVILVSHEVAKRGWKDVKKGEMCKIPGLGPVAPEVAKEIGKDAFLTGVFFDGKDLRNIKRYGRYAQVEIKVALELGEPPDFPGVKCDDCGNRFRTEFDHVEPRAARGPTSYPNLKPRCWACHQAKTARDRRARQAETARPVRKTRSVPLA